MKTNDVSKPVHFTADPDRYSAMRYQHAGRSGLQLPALALGLWHNFGDVDDFRAGQGTLRRAFDLGIVHWDLANNYGPPYGSAEQNFGKMLKADFAAHRDELIIATKAGYDMWPGPYGNGGSRKYLIASLDQSLARMGLEYVDIFYHHCPDPATPVEESLGAVRDIIRQGKALYAGISNYGPELTRQAATFFREERVPFVLHQARYNILDRSAEDGLLDVLDESGLACIAFSPLAQGLLTDRYLAGIPSDSRAGRPGIFLNESDVLQQQDRILLLNEIAAARNQTLAQMAIAWLLTRKSVCSVLIGASSADQLASNVAALENTDFDATELKRIDSL